MVEWGEVAMEKEVEMTMVEWGEVAMEKGGVEMTMVEWGEVTMEKGGIEVTIVEGEVEMATVEWGEVEVTIVEGEVEVTMVEEERRVGAILVEEIRTMKEGEIKWTMEEIRVGANSMMQD